MLVGVLGGAAAALALRSSASGPATTSVAAVSRVTVAGDVARALQPVPESLPKPKPVAKPTVAKPQAAKKVVTPPDPFERYGYDVSWPQCRTTGSVIPPAQGGSAIVGITGGRPFTSNPCLASQWAWAKTRAHHSAYINLAYPKTLTDPYNYGLNTARSALSTARSAGLKLSGVWLDVEVGNHWSLSTVANNAVIRGAVAAVKAAGIQAGIYSTPLNWIRITGNARINGPLWLAVADPNVMLARCAGPGIGGRAPDMVQASKQVDGHIFDWDLSCATKPDFLKVLD